MGYLMNVYISDYTERELIKECDWKSAETLLFSYFSPILLSKI